MNHMTRRRLITTSIVGGVSLATASESHLTAFATPAAPAASPKTALKAQIVLFDGFEVTDALAPFDALQISASLGSLFEITLVTVNKATEVIALDNVHVKPTAAFDPSGDLLIVPGAPKLWRAGLIPEGLTQVLQHMKYSHFVSIREKNRE